MASLDKVKPKTPTLNKVADLIRTRAIYYAPKKTGNLRNKLRDFNRPVGMVKTKIENKKIQISFQIDVAPPGAKYGKWWNSPDVSWQVRKGGNPKNIDFAQQAFDDPEVNNAIELLLDEVMNDMVEYIGSEIRVI